jgi:hypothetical protein
LGEITRGNNYFKLLSHVITGAGKSKNLQGGLEAETQENFAAVLCQKGNLEAGFLPSWCSVFSPTYIVEVSHFTNLNVNSI